MYSSLNYPLPNDANKNASKTFETHWNGKQILKSIVVSNLSHPHAFSLESDTLRLTPGAYEGGHHLRYFFHPDGQKHSVKMLSGGREIQTFSIAPKPVQASRVPNDNSQLLIENLNDYKSLRMDSNGKVEWHLCQQENPTTFALNFTDAERKPIKMHLFTVVDSRKTPLKNGKLKIDFRKANFFPSPAAAVPFPHQQPMAHPMPMENSTQAPQPVGQMILVPIQVSRDGQPNSNQPGVIFPGQSDQRGSPGEQLLIVSGDQGESCQGQLDFVKRTERLMAYQPPSRSPAKSAVHVEAGAIRRPAFREGLDEEGVKKAGKEGEKGDGNAVVIPLPVPPTKAKQAADMKNYYTAPYY